MRSRRRRTGLLAALAATGILASSLTTTASAAGARPAAPEQAGMSRVLGMGSSYVDLAMQQWVADVNVRGVPVQYQQTGSPDGLSRFNTGTVDFAGTEAEFSSLNLSNEVARGYQYVPDIAGAVAVMYNVQDQAGRKVDYLHLSRQTVARIFVGEITSWADAAISADNRGLQLPDQPITVVYRSNLSGTTALFYDFVANTDPGAYQRFVARLGLDPNNRILLPRGPSGAEISGTTFGAGDSADMARHVANTTWTIGYDEFGFPKTFGAEVAWIQNQAGNWVLPYARNISAALDGATLRPDLSQELSTVYSNPHPEAYPISAYSYIVTQCAPTSDRATCRGPYVDAGVAETLTAFLEHIACDGQVPAAEIGYSPLPPHLSQEIINSIGRMRGEAPRRQLTAENCSNPRFRGQLGEGSGAPPDPLDGIDCIGSSCDSSGGPQQQGGPGGTAGPAAGATDTSEAAGAAGSESADLVEGGSAETRDTDPASYNEDAGPSLGKWALIMLLALLAVPVFAGSFWAWFHNRRPPGPTATT